jgi:hypothetical protein
LWGTWEPLNFLLLSPAGHPPCPRAPPIGARRVLERASMSCHKHHPNATLLATPLHCTAPSVPTPHTRSPSCSRCHMRAPDAVSLVGAPPRLSRELLTQYRPRRLLHHSGAPSHHELRPWELSCAYELLHIPEHCPSRRA